MDACVLYFSVEWGMVKNIILSAIVTGVVVGYGWLCTAASLGSFARFSHHANTAWQQTSTWSGVTNPGWGGFSAITQTHKVGALGVLVEPQAYLKPALIPVWQQASVGMPNLQAFVWRSGNSGADYPVYFVGGISVQKLVALPDDKTGVVPAKFSLGWQEAGLLQGALVKNAEYGVISTPQ